MTGRDSITRPRARTPGAEDHPSSWRRTIESTARLSTGPPMWPRGARRATTNQPSAVHAGSWLKPVDVLGRSRLKSRPSSRNEENSPCGMIGGVEETSALFEARSAPRSYPTTGENPPYGILEGTVETSASFEARSAPRSYSTGLDSCTAAAELLRKGRRLQKRREVS